MTTYISGTAGVTPPTWTTATRPVNPGLGTSGWNTTLNQFEVFVGGSSWIAVAATSYAIDYLIVAGGGGGGSGGGGAGGVITGYNVPVVPGTSYSLVVGAGGSGVTSNPSTTGNNTAGAVSTGFGYTALGGGRGGTQGGGAIGVGGTGGSGGGSSYDYLIAASGTVGQGYAGGKANQASFGGAGGGGGAGEVGGNGTLIASNISRGGKGGDGIVWPPGSGTYYGGGGGGGANTDTTPAGPSTPGLGGGGYDPAGIHSYTGAAVSGIANTGGGGGGNEVQGGAGGAGGSGIVIVRYQGSASRATGGTITISGGYVYHTFTGSGTFVA